MEAVEGNIQEAFSLTVRLHRSAAKQSSHSGRVSASRRQSFKSLLGGAVLPQLTQLLSARRFQHLVLYPDLLNPKWCVPKSLPAVLCIPHSDGQMLRLLHSNLEDPRMRLLQLLVYPHRTPEACLNMNIFGFWHLRCHRRSHQCHFFYSILTRWSQGVNRAQSMSACDLWNHGKPCTNSYACIGTTSMTDLYPSARESNSWTVNRVFRCPLNVASLLRSCRGWWCALRDDIPSRVGILGDMRMLVASLSVRARTHCIPSFVPHLYLMNYVFRIRCFSNAQILTELTCPRALRDDWWL